MTPSEARHKFLAPRRTRQQVSGFRSLGDMVAQAATRILTPPETISVSRAAERYVTIEKAGSWSEFRNTAAPYMVEPMDVTESRDFDGCVFVSSAQSGKTASLVLNKMAYNIAVSGMDMMIVCQSGAAATDFAVRRVDRTIGHSEKLKAQLLQVRNADNQKRKTFKSGMLLTLAHPAKNELSGKPIGNVCITDYDRIDDNIEGEGSAWTQAHKRSQTFMSYRMTIAESSPSRPVRDAKKILDEHEAPDCGGIMELYNRGDRRMWYWPCPSCDTYFSPHWNMIRWDEKAGSHDDQADTVRMHCPHCDFAIHPDHRHDMQQWGQWLGAGERMDGSGERRRSRIASFWLDGTAASFITWKELVVKYLDAAKSYNDTLDDKDLMTFWNQDLGRPYVPKAQEMQRTPELLMSRMESISDRGLVPYGVRAIVHTIDVQKNYFDVQAHGIMPGVPCDLTVIDRFRVDKSEREDETGDHFRVKPSAYQEDWNLLVDQVLLRTYPLADGSGRRMQSKLTLCDAGGHAEKYNVRAQGSGGVTEKAYQFYRDLGKLGLANRFHLVRGAFSRQGKRAWIDKPDGNNGKLGIARGDVPVLYLNSNEVKDILSERLDVIEPGKGMIHFGDWLPEWFFGELCQEVWTDKGWLNPQKRRNESWDLMYYLIGSTFSPLLPIQQVNWDKPPMWLSEWDTNSFVLPAPEPDETEAPRVFTQRKKIDFAALGAAIG